MSLNIIRSSELAISDAVTCLVYGLPRTGKTQFAASAGDDNLIINLGGGVSTLKGETYRKMVGQNPMIIDLDEDYDKDGLPLATGFDKVGSVIDEALQNRAALKFNTITIDEGTSLAAMAMMKAVKFNSDINKTDTWTKIVKKYDLMLPIMPDMGAQRSVLEQFCDYYCKLAKKENFNFILVAHEKDTYEKVPMGAAAQVDKRAPYFTGESAKVIPGYFEWVLRMESVSGGSSLSCRAWTIGSEKMIAGVRIGGIFEEKISNPNFSKMVQQAKEFKSKHLAK